MKYIFQSNSLENTALMFFKDPKKSFSILVGGTVITAGIAYQYGIKILYNIGAIFSIAYGNTQIAKFAIEKGNAGLYDFAATFAEILHWISPSWFSKIDSNPALIQGIVNIDPEMIDFALNHNADVNKEGRTGRPVEFALNSNSEYGSLIAAQLISHNADLSKSSSQNINLFWLTIYTSKKELVYAAMKQAMKNNVLIDSTNKEGNSIVHLIPTSTDLQNVAIDLNFVETFPKNTLSNANHDGKNPVDIAMYMHKNNEENINEELIKQYLLRADTETSQKHFGDIINSPKLYKVAEQLVAQKDFDGDIRDSSVNKKLPIDYLLTSDGSSHNNEDSLNDFINKNLNSELIKDHEFRDKLAVSIIEKTNEWLLKNVHLFNAYLNDMPDTIDKLHEQAFSKDTAMQSFFNKPQGNQSKGKTLLHLMADDTIPFNKQQFEKIAYFLFKKTTLNPFNKQDDYQMNVAATACASKNFDIITLIIDIEHKLKQQLAQSTKKNQVFIFGSSLQNDLFILHAQQKSMIQFLPKKAIDALPLQTQNMLTITNPTNKFLELNTDNDNNDNPNLALFTPLTEEKELDLQDRMDKIGHNQLQMKEYSSLRRNTVHSLSRKKEQQKKSLGIPKELKLTSIDHSKIPQIHQNEALIITGVLTKQLTMYKGLFSIITGLDLEGSFITTSFYVITFAGAGYVEAYGRGYTNAKTLALIGAGTYGAAEFMKGTAYNEHTPSEERGILDFTYKYGSYILMNVPISLLYQAAFAATGGPIYGKTGMIKSSSITLSISLMQSHMIYTADIEESLKCEGFDCSNYFTTENIIALGAAFYIEYHYTTLTTSVNNVMLSANPLIIGKLTLDLLSTISTFFIMKLTSGTVLSITKPVIEYAQTAFEPLMKDAHKIISSSTHSSIVLLNDYITSFNANNYFKNIYYDIIAVLSDYVTNNNKDTYYNTDEFCMDGDNSDIVIPAGNTDDLMCPNIYSS